MATEPPPPPPPAPPARKVTRAELFGLYVSQLGLISRLQEAISILLRDPLASVRWSENGVTRSLTLPEARQRYRAEATRGLQMFDQLCASGLRVAEPDGTHGRPAGS